MLLQRLPYLTLSTGYHFLLKNRDFMKKKAYFRALKSKAVMNFIIIFQYLASKIDLRRNSKSNGLNCIAF